METYGNITTPDALVELRRNTHISAALAEALVAALPEAVRIPIEDTGLYYINPDHIPALTELLQEIVAYTVASVINAGSERDAVMENDDLFTAIAGELHTWAKDGGNSTDED